MNNVRCELELLCCFRHEKVVVVLPVTGIYRELSPFSTSAVFLSTVAVMQDLYTASKVTFLLDASDTVAAYEATSTLSPTASTSSTLEGGLTAFSTELNHVQQVEALQSQFVCACMRVHVKNPCVRVLHKAGRNGGLAWKTIMHVMCRDTCISRHNAAICCLFL